MYDITFVPTDTNTIDLYEVFQILKFSYPINFSSVQLNLMFDCNFCKQLE